MVGATMTTSVGHRILSCFSHEVQPCQDPLINLSDTVFEFLQQESQEHAAQSIDFSHHDDDSQDEETENASLNNEQSLKFWETQQHLLQATLRRTSSLETRIRNITKNAVKELQPSTCSCRIPVTGSCRNCTMREICDRLQTEGFDSAICKCKWRSSPDIPPAATMLGDELNKMEKEQEQDAHTNPSLLRRYPIFSLTLDDFQNAFPEEGKNNYGSMNMEEFINNFRRGEEAEMQEAVLPPTQPQLQPQDHDQTQTLAHSATTYETMTNSTFVSGECTSISIQSSYPRQISVV